MAHGVDRAAGTTVLGAVAALAALAGTDGGAAAAAPAEANIEDTKMATIATPGIRRLMVTALLHVRSKAECATGARNAGAHGNPRHQWATGANRPNDTTCE
jgi:hypothetical protein